MPKVKDKQRILKAAREKQLISSREVPIRLSADFSKETLQANRDRIMNTKSVLMGGAFEGMGD